MKKVLSLLLMISFCLFFSSSSEILAKNVNQDKKKEKVKVILVSGIVTDEQGNGLKGVIIMAVRESKSDMPFGIESVDGGKYNIRLKSNQALTFSLNGYETQIISINGRDEIDVVMKKVKN